MTCQFPAIEAFLKGFVAKNDLRTFHNPIELYIVHDVECF